MKKILYQFNQPQVQKSLLLVLSAITITAIAHAQSDPGGDPGAAPIDGGLSLLVAAGVGYGVKKMRKNKQQKEETGIEK